MATILIVDDDTTSQRLMAFILQQHAHAAVMAMNGRQALERLAIQSFDLVITDLNMPELDGLALLKHVRSEQRFHNMPVVILTGGIHEQDNLRPFMDKKMAFLTKPAGSDEVIAVVNRLLGTASSNGIPSDESVRGAESAGRSDARKLLELGFKQKIHVI